MRKPILYNVILSTVIVVCFVFLIYPLYGEISKLTEKLKKRTEELQLKREYFSKLSGLKQHLDNAEEKLVKIKSSLPPDPGILDLSNFILALSSKNGLVLKGISMTKERKSFQGDETIKITFLDVRLAGFYDSFKNFLLELQKSSRLIEVNKISFSVPSSLTQQKPDSSRGVATAGNVIDFGIKISFASY